MRKALRKSAFYLVLACFIHVFVSTILRIHMRGTGIYYWGVGREGATMSSGLTSWHPGSMGNSQSANHRPMLGQLLVGAGVVPETSVQECLVRAKNDASRIGEALVIAGHIDAQCLQSTILVQDLV